MNNREDPKFLFRYLTKILIFVFHGNNSESIKKPGFANKSLFNNS